VLALAAGALCALVGAAIGVTDGAREAAQAISDNGYESLGFEHGSLALYERSTRAGLESGAALGLRLGVITFAALAVLGWVGAARLAAWLAERRHVGWGATR